MSVTEIGISLLYLKQITQLALTSSQAISIQESQGPPKNKYLNWEEENDQERESKRLQRERASHSKTEHSLFHDPKYTYYG